MSKKVLSRRVVAIAVALLSVLGWAFFAVSQITVHITKGVHDQSKLASSSFIKSISELEDKNKANMLERYRMHSAYKTTLDNLSQEIESLSQLGTRSSRLNATLRMENELLQADNYSIMESNRDLAEGVQALQIKVAELKK